MHILVTADAVGGVWSYTEELVRGLLRRGLRVTLVCFGPEPSEEQRRWLRELAGVEFLAAGYSLEWMPEAASDLAASMRYLTHLVEFCRPDLLHLSQFCYGALDVRVPKVVVAHSDVLSWHRAVRGTVPHDAWALWYRAVVERGLEGATQVVAPSKWMRSAIDENYAVRRPIEVIVNGRTPGRFSPQTKKRGYAASMGRLWDEGKQLSLLTELSELPLPVAVAGSTQAPSGQRAESAKPGCEKLDLLGELNDEQVRRFLGSAELYIATSRYEPFGLAPLEAALSGCALLLNDIPSLRELWGDDAVYFRRNHPLALHAALRRLAADPALCASYGERACLRALEHYTAGRMVDDYLALYAGLLERRAIAA